MAGRRGGAPTRTGRVDATAVDPAERAREIALRLLTHADRSAAQLRDGLTSRDVPEDVADQVIERYVEVGLLDDAALAATIVRTRHAERGQAARAIREELRRKGFERADIEDALGQLDADQERERAHELGRARWERLGAHPPEVRARRVFAMLGRKGYSASIARDVVTDLQRADTEH